MSLTYVIADLHGRLDLLKLAVARIRRHDSSPATVVFLGDYVDRGPQSAQIIDVLIEGEKNAKQRWICLKGNHEDMMAGALRGGNPHCWLSNGGHETMASYEGMEWPQKAHDHLRWIDGLKLVHWDRHRIYVHAGIDPTRSLLDQREVDLLWMRYATNFDIGLPFDLAQPTAGSWHVVHGHTPSSKNPRTWGDRTCLDTGAYDTGRLVVGVFHNEIPGGPIDTLTVKA